jgi:hypothetical protein
MTSRGIRNNNPGNLDKGSDWQGLAADQTDERFCVFIAPVWGIRALAKVLLAYYAKHHLATVREIIRRWAPPTENDSGAYVAAVSNRMGVNPDALLKLTERKFLKPLVEAIIQHENGSQPYDDATIDEALTKAGVA